MGGSEWKYPLKPIEQFRNFLKKPVENRICVSNNYKVYDESFAHIRELIAQRRHRYAKQN